MLDRNEKRTQRRDLEGRGGGGGGGSCGEDYCGGAIYGTII